MKPALYTLCGIAVLLCAPDLLPLFVPAFVIGILASAAVSGGFRS